MCSFSLGILNGPDIKKLMNTKTFDEKLNEQELNAWICIKNVIHNFLGNKKADNYEILVADMMRAFKELKVDMSLKIHMLFSHLEFFPENLGEVSDEHGEKFHQEMSDMEKRFKGKPVVNMLAEYCWSIKLNPELPQPKKK